MKLKNPWILLVSIALLLGLLSGLGRLMRTQQPFSCFAPTYDENVHIHAVTHMVEAGSLTDYRMSETDQPFDPILSSGYPFALAGIALQKITHRILPEAPLTEQVTLALRLASYLSFALLIMALVRLSGPFQSTATPNPWIPIVSLSVFLWLWTAFPSAAYSVYAAFAESMALFFAALSVRRFIQNRTFQSAVFCALAIAAKPTMILFAPALALTCLSLKKTMRSLVPFVLVVGGCLLAQFGLEAAARHESLSHFLSVMRGFAQAVALSSPMRLGEWFSLQPPMIRGSLLATLCILYLPLSASPSESSRVLTSFGRNLVLLTIALYVLKGTSPGAKHLLCLITLPLWIAVTRFAFWFRWPLERLNSWQHPQITQAIVVTLAIAWIANVPGLLIRSYKDADITTCDARSVHWINQLDSTLPRFARVDLARSRQWPVAEYDLKTSPEAFVLLKHTQAPMPAGIQCKSLKNTNLAQALECTLASPPHSR